MKGGRVPKILLIVPLTAILVAVISLFLSAPDEKLLSARIVGGPTDSPGQFSGRVQLLQLRGELSIPAPRRRVALRSRSADSETTLALTTDADGWASFSFPKGEGEELSLEVTADDQLLLRGAPRLAKVRWAASAKRRGATVSRYVSGDWEVIFHQEAPLLSVPFSSTLRLEFRPLVGEGKLPSLQLEGEGVHLLDEEKGGRWKQRLSWERPTKSIEVGVRPDHHVATLRLSSTNQEGKIHVTHSLSIAVGAAHLSRVKGHFRVRSAVPRDALYYALVTEEERLWSGRVELREDEEGFFSGDLSPEAWPEAKGRYLVVASSATGRGAGSIGYPLDGQEESFDPVDAYLMDGTPARKRETRRRVSRLRIVVAFYIALSGVVTLALFFRHIRSEDQLLSQRFVEAGIEEKAEGRGSIPLTVALVCLFFAFSAVVLWIVAR